MLAVEGTDDEDDELKDAENQSILGGRGSLQLSLKSVKNVVFLEDVITVAVYMRTVTRTSTNIDRLI